MGAEHTHETVLSSAQNKQPEVENTLRRVCVHVDNAVSKNSAKYIPVS